MLRGRLVHWTSLSRFYANSSQKSEEKKSLGRTVRFSTLFLFFPFFSIHLNTHQIYFSYNFFPFSFFPSHFHPSKQGVRPKICPQGEINFTLFFFLLFYLSKKEGFCLLRCPVFVVDITGGLSMGRRMIELSKPTVAV